MNKLIILSFLSAISNLFLSCSQENHGIDRDLMHDYYPLYLKQVLIYDVDSTFYDQFDNSITNYKFEIKDSVASKFLSIIGDTVYRVERYKKLEGSNKWFYQKTIAKTKTLRLAEETIDNQTFIKLNFPFKLYSEWNGNSKNNLGSQPYYISTFPARTLVNNLNFEPTVVIQQAEESNFLREDNAFEVYAKNVGLIHKEVIAVDKNTSTQRFVHGFTYSMKIKSF